jgi:secreted trypsin-like serine protease
VQRRHRQSKSLARESISSCAIGPRAIVLSLILLLTGCGKSTSDLFIFGGQPVMGDAHDETVAIVSQSPETGWTLLCTGTLITPQHVVTAAHCLDGLSSQQRARESISLDQMGVVRGNSLEDQIPEERVRALHAAQQHPQYKKGPRGNNDIAILRLATPMEGVRPAKLLHTFADLERSRNVTWRLVGFGSREDGSKGEKYFADTNARNLHAQEAIVGGDGLDACLGDSGGPAFVNLPHTHTVPTIGGVVSRGVGVGCGAGGYVTMISDHVCWIESLTSQSLTPWWSDSGCSWRESIPRPDSFVDACLGSSHPAHVAAARVIKKRLGAQSCRSADEMLKTATDLDLSDAMLRNIDVLTGSLTQDHALRRINLRGNELRDLNLNDDRTKPLEIDVGYNDLSEQTLRQLSATQNVRVLGAKLQRRNFRETSFLAMCDDEAVSEPAKRTVAAIRYSLLGGTCAATNVLLVKRTSLRLSGRGISDVTPLAGLQALEKLDLSRNPDLRDLRPLVGMERLQLLDLRGSPLADVSTLSELAAGGLEILRD